MAKTVTYGGVTVPLVESASLRDLAAGERKFKASTKEWAESEQLAFMVALSFRRANVGVHLTIDDILDADVSDFTFEDDDAEQGAEADEVDPQPTGDEAGPTGSSPDADGTSPD